MTPDLDAHLRDYAIRQRRARAARYESERRDRLRAVRHEPVTHTWTPPPTKPPDFRVALDARIDHCPGCDAWRFDRTCPTCLTTTIPRSATA